MNSLPYRLDLIRFCKAHNPADRRVGAARQGRRLIVRQSSDVRSGPSSKTSTSERYRQAGKARSLLLRSKRHVPTNRGVAKKSVRSLLSKRASLSGKFPDTGLDNVQ
jgi:hypothetical protein